MSESSPPRPTGGSGSTRRETGKLPGILSRYPEPGPRAAFMFVGGFFSLGILAGLAMLLRAPLVFPSLGPTAFLFFFTPLAPPASPRNAVCGHAVGILCGYASLWLCGLTQAPTALPAGVDGGRVFAVAFSLASTGALMILLRVPHPPAGATTLIISLGALTKPAHLLIIEVAVVLLTLLAIAFHRLAGTDYPLWARPEP